jgi:hypothetical protein
VSQAPDQKENARGSTVLDRSGRRFTKISAPGVHTFLPKPFILAGDILGDARTGKNGRHALVGMLRSALQEFYSIHKLRYLYAQQAKIWDLPTNGNDYGCIAIAAACHFCPVNA